MKKIAWLLALCLAALGIGGCSPGPVLEDASLKGTLEGQSYFSPAAGMEIRYPQDWVVEAEEIGENPYIFGAVTGTPPTDDPEAEPNECIALSFCNTGSEDYLRAYGVEGKVRLTAREHVDHFIAMVTPDLKDDERISGEDVHIAGEDRVLLRFMMTGGNFVAYLYSDAGDYMSSVLFYCDEEVLEERMEQALHPYNP